MNKRNKIIYWITTLWLSLGMTVSGVFQLIKPQEEIDILCKHLGYPEYFLSIIGVWKLLGVITILIPKFPLLKEWAYAGFFFLMTGALVSYLYLKDPLSEAFGPCLLIVLSILSWYFRPAKRKLNY
ncbi:MAG TPA: DoxX family protein [Bacteroidia bacterium]|nr:DoxX family protein [Bacteroidia bacterium]